MNQVKKIRPTLLSIAIVCNLYVTLYVPTSQAADVPEGFSSLFEMEKRIVEFEDTTGKFHSVSMDVNYDTIRLSSQKSIKKIKQIFLNDNVDPDLISQILSDLSKGVKNSTGCEGDIASCVLTPESYALVYDYYTNKVFFWINPKYLKTDFDPEKVNYANALNEHPATINHFNAYGRVGQDGSNYTLNDKVTVGLPYGNITSELNYREVDDDFEVDELLYNLEFKDYKTQIGYTNNRTSFNATDFLVNDVDNGEWAFEFGTSNNLVLNGQRSIQKIFFFAPQNGVLTIYRDDRIILQKNVEQGQGFITNEDLPKGRYDVRMVIRAGDSIVSQQTQAIFNTSNDSLLIGGYDYHIITGIYGQSDSDLLDAFDIDDSTDAIDEKIIGEGFVRGLIAYRLNNEITLGAGISGSSVGNYLNLGTSIYLPYKSDLTLSTYIYDDSSVQFETSFGLDNWTLSYERFNTSDNDDEGELAKYMFQDADYDKFSVSTSFELGQSRFGYLTYNYIDQDGSGLFAGYTSSYLSGGVSFNSIIDSTIDFNASYDFSDNSNRDQLSASIVWSVPLSSLITGKATVRTTESGITQVTSGLETGDLIDDSDIYLTAQASQTYSESYPNNYSTLTASGTISKDSFGASAYTYLDTTGERSINANISSTQVFTGKNVYFTRHEADSYVAIDSDSNIRFDKNSASRGLLVVNGNDRQEKRQTLYKDKVILPLRDYRSYNTTLDTDSVDLYNIGDNSAHAFSLPGTVLEIKPKLSRVITFISGFKDIFDQSMSNVECQGEGCVSLTEVTDGVYKISVKEGEKFTLNRNDEICTIPPVDDAKLFNFGENYCFPNIAKLSSSIINIDGVNKKVYFIGEFSTNETKKIIDKQIEQLTAQTGLEFLKKEIGRNSYIYAIADQNYIVTAQAQSIFNNMSKYANVESSILKKYALQR